MFGFRVAEGKNRLLGGVSKLGLVAVLGTALSACATDPRTTGSVSATPNGSHTQTLQNVQKLNALYSKDPRDRTAALRFADALRRSGNTEQAVAVLQQAAALHNEDIIVQSAYGKALAADGRLEEALRVIQDAQRPEQPDWRLISAEGAIFDQLGKHNEARALYRKALNYNTNAPSVYSNMGMSFVLTGDLSKAEETLRRAQGLSPNDGRIRQNLALVLGLQGRFEEAEQVAQSDLPADQARENVAFLRAMLSQQNVWKNIKKQGS